VRSTGLVAESRPLPRGVFLLVRPCPLAWLRTWTALRTVQVVETFGTRRSGRQKYRMGYEIDPPMEQAVALETRIKDRSYARQLLLRGENAQPTRTVPRVSELVLMRSVSSPRHCLANGEPDTDREVPFSPAIRLRVGLQAAQRGNPNWALKKRAEPPADQE
jgi:hypothetical protein